MEAIGTCVRHLAVPLAHRANNVIISPINFFKLWNCHSRFFPSEMYNFLNGGNWHLCPTPCPSSSLQSKQCDYFFFFKPKNFIPDFVHLKWIIFWMEAIGTVAWHQPLLLFKSERQSMKIKWRGKWGAKRQWRDGDSALCARGGLIVNDIVNGRMNFVF